MSKRFITDINNIKKEKDRVKIVGEEVLHINVLRYKVGDTLYVNEYMIKITSISKEELTGIIVGKLEKKGEPKINITLIQSYLKSDKMEYVTKKAVELGVKKIAPIITRNTVVKLEEKDKLKKKERLVKIAKEAVEQCGRTDEVEILDIVNISQVDFSKYDCIIVCHETSTVSIKESIKQLKKEENLNNIALVIGPEGGLDETDLKEFKGLKNVYIVSLGERVLRAETASLNIISIITYEFDI